MLVCFKLPLFCEFKLTFSAGAEAVVDFDLREADLDGLLVFFGAANVIPLSFFEVHPTNTRYYALQHLAQYFGQPDQTYL